MTNLDPPEENYAPEPPTAEELVREQELTPVEKYQMWRDMLMIAVGLPMIAIGFIRKDTLMLIFGAALTGAPGFGGMIAAAVPEEEERDPRDPGQKEWRG